MVEHNNRLPETGKITKIRKHPISAKERLNQRMAQLSRLSEQYLQAFQEDSPSRYLPSGKYS